MAVFSKLSKDRFRRFRMIKRAWYSFIILSALFVLSLFAELLCNDRPYIISFNDKLYFPIFKFYPEKEFGGKYLTEADYVSLRNSDLFKKEGNWMLLPPFHTALCILTWTLRVPLRILHLRCIGWERMPPQEMSLPDCFMVSGFVCSFLSFLQGLPPCLEF